MIRGAFSTCFPGEATTERAFPQGGGILTRLLNRRRFRFGGFALRRCHGRLFLDFGLFGAAHKTAD